MNVIFYIIILGHVCVSPTFYLFIYFFFEKLDAQTTEIMKLVKLAPLLR